MAKFDAGTIVERLEFDFSDFGGPTGVIQEPTTRRVNAFFKSTKDTIREVQDLRKSAEFDSVNIEEMSEAEVAEALGKVDEASEGATRMQERTVENLAILCGADVVYRDSEGNVIRGDEVPADATRTIEGGSPTFETLDNLPFRVLQAFTTWLIDQIRPKGNQGPVTKR